MTETTADAPPALGIGRDWALYTQAALAWSRAVAEIRRRRAESARRAWSVGEASDREAALTQALADPRARSMSTVEREAWTAYTRPDADGPRPVDVMDRRVEGPQGSVTVTLAPMPNDPGAWGLHAVGSSSTEPENPAQTALPTETYVRCRDESIAKELADDLLARGRDGVERLDQFAQAAAQRAAAAAAGLVESSQQRQVRMAEILRSRWAAHPELVEEMIRPAPHHRAQGHLQWNPAFAALCSRIAQLEEQGFTVVEVLDRLLSPAGLSEPEVHNPSAFAEWTLEKLVDRSDGIYLGELPDGVRLDSLRRDRARARADHARDDHARNDVGRGSGQSVPSYDRSAERPPTDVLQRLAKQHQEQRRRHIQARNAAVEPALEKAVGPQLLATLRRSRHYGQLLEDLYSRHQAGLDLTGHLSNLPTKVIERAGNPAAYLRAGLKNAAMKATATAQAGRDSATVIVVAADAAQPIGVDRAAMAEVLQRAGGAEFADQVTADPSWPRLAQRMQTFSQAGLPLDATIAALAIEKRDWISSRYSPAAAVHTLLKIRLDAQLAANDTAGPITDTAGNDPTTAAATAASAVGDNTADAAPAEAVAANKTAREDADPAEAPSDVDPSAGVLTRTSVLDPLIGNQLPDPAAAHLPEPPASEGPSARWRDLDPASAIDRVGIEASRGGGSVAADDAIDAVLGAAAADTAGPASLHAVEADVGEPGPVETERAPEMIEPDPDPDTVATALPGAPAGDAATSVPAGAAELLPVPGEHPATTAARAVTPSADVEPEPARRTSRRRPSQTPQRGLRGQDPQRGRHR